MNDGEASLAKKPTRHTLWASRNSPTKAIMSTSLPCFPARKPSSMAHIARRAMHSWVILPVGSTTSEANSRINGNIWRISDAEAFKWSVAARSRASEKVLSTLLES